MTVPALSLRAQQRKCRWCGRFYASPLPEESACADHITEHNEQLRRDIERFNAKLLAHPAARPEPETT